MQERGQTLDRLAAEKRRHTFTETSTEGLVQPVSFPRTLADCMIGNGSFDQGLSALRSLSL